MSEREKYYTRHLERRVQRLEEQVATLDRVLERVKGDKEQARGIAIELYDLLRTTGVRQRSRSFQVVRGWKRGA